MKRKQVAFIADPLSQFNPKNETTLFFMREAARRKAEVYFCEPKDLFIENGQVKAKFLQLRMKAGKDFYQVLSEKVLNCVQMNVIFLRKDPPFDQAYLEHLQILSLIEDQVRMINRPSGILSSGEKLFPLKFAHLGPQTLISSEYEKIYQFAISQKCGTILKPLGLSGGRQIYFVSPHDLRNLEVIAEQMTDSFTRHIVLQSFLPKVRLGDKRVLLYRGSSLGAFKRIPKQGSVRSNLHAGGFARKVALTKLERHVIAELREDLLARGLDFVGLDLIDGKLTEVNVTSPMGIAEINQLDAKKIERIIFDDLFD